MTNKKQKIIYHSVMYSIIQNDRHTERKRETKQYKTDQCKSVQFIHKCKQ